MTGQFPKPRQKKQEEPCYFKIIGDVHGTRNYGRYLDLTKQCEISLQLGDMGFEYQTLIDLGIDSRCHQFFGGNHDNYDVYHLSPHALLDGGQFELGKINAWYVRGAFSVDNKWRIAQERQRGLKTWWEQEQLTQESMQLLHAQYLSDKPKVMITHTCPQSIAQKIGDPGVLRNLGFNPDTFTTRTQGFLETLFDYHKPELWVFGHFHKGWLHRYLGTQFICLPELGSLDFDENLNYEYMGLKGQL